MILIKSIICKEEIINESFDEMDNNNGSIYGAIAMWVNDHEVLSQFLLPWEYHKKLGLYDDNLTFAFGQMVDFIQALKRNERGVIYYIFGNLVELVGIPGEMVELIYKWNDSINEKYDVIWNECVELSELENAVKNAIQGFVDELKSINEKLLGMKNLQKIIEFVE